MTINSFRYDESTEMDIYPCYRCGSADPACLLDSRKKFNSEFEKTYSLPLPKLQFRQIQLPLREGEYFLSDAEHAMMLI
ncbi:MAG: hypothetical protein IPN15_11055 [Saprospiraceae bacterium]|nr:hypothetical protein [Candidatus Vicinibacter affinis]